MHHRLEPKDDRCRWNGRLVAVGALLLAALVAGAGPAWAVSGDVLDLDGLYTITPASCNAVRAKSDTILDVIVPCSAEARDDNARVCDIVTGVSGTNLGLNIGQCQDSLPVPLSPPAPGADYETDTRILATTFGSDIAYIRVPGLSTDADVICNTFAGGVKKCIKVVPVDADCPPEGCNLPTCGITAFADPTCAEVRDQLRTAVTTDPPELSHYLAIDIQDTSGPDYLAVGVCPNFKWVCSDPAAPGPLSARYYDQLLLATVETPVCLTFNRKIICR